MIIILLTVVVSMASVRGYHVSITGNDLHEGTAAKPLRTVSAAVWLWPVDVHPLVFEIFFLLRIWKDFGHADDVFAFAENMISF